MVVLLVDAVEVVDVLDVVELVVDVDVVLVVGLDVVVWDVEVVVEWEVEVVGWLVEVVVSHPAWLDRTPNTARAIRARTSVHQPRVGNRSIASLFLPPCAVVRSPIARDGPVVKIGRNKAEVPTTKRTPARAANLSQCGTAPVWQTVSARGPLIPIDAPKSVWLSPLRQNNRLSNKQASAGNDPGGRRGGRAKGGMQAD